MKAGLLLGLLLWSSCVMGQIHGGLRLNFQFSRVVLASGDTLDGPVAVHFGPDLLYLARPDGSIRTFAPAAIAAFAVQGERIVTGQGRLRTPASFDPTLVRLFRTLLWPSEHPGQQRPELAFFEQLSEGPVLLLRRQALASRLTALNASGASLPTSLGRGAALPMGRPMPLNPAPMYYTNVTEIQDEYFLAWPTGELVRLQKPKRDLPAAFPGQASQLQAYAKAQGLGYVSARDLHELVSYVNSLLGLASK